MRRELAIALRARVTWIVAALAALLVGHGFVLAVDLFSAASRSALSGALQARELDPLAGVVRPTLGGVDLALALLGPVVAARVVSVEKERGTFGTLLLLVGAPWRVALAKALAAYGATALLLVPAVVHLALYRASGGHVDLVEVSVALAGELGHVAVVVAVAVAAAAWTSTLAQAVTVAIVVNVASWLVEAGEGFAALAWLGRAEAWSIERHVAPFQRGLVALGPLAWLLVGTAGALALAITGARVDLPARRRGLLALPVSVAMLLALHASASVHAAYDWTEQRRASLPLDVVAGLRAIPAPIALEVRLDRDDSRRRQLESDVLAKLRLARPDATLTFPLDEAGGSLTRGEAYGTIRIRVGDAERETRSTSRKEVVTLVLEAAGGGARDWTASPYPGFPVVVEGAARGLLVTSAYLLVPLALLGLGLGLSRRRPSR